MRKEDWRARADHRLQTWEPLRKALLSVEWVTNEGDDEAHCPSCMAWRHMGHWLECDLLAALEVSKEEQEDGN